MVVTLAKAAQWSISFPPFPFLPSSLSSNSFALPGVIFMDNPVLWRHKIPRHQSVSWVLVCPSIR